MRMTLVLLVVVLLAPGAWAQDDPANIARLNAVDQRVKGTGRPASAGDRRATAYEIMEWYGLRQVAKNIERVEREADALIAEHIKLEADLLAKKKLLEERAGSTAVQAGEAGMDQKGVGWYCQRAGEIMPVLLNTATAITRIADTYATSIGNVPIGKDDSARKLDQATQQFQAEVSSALSDSTTRAMIQDLDKVAVGLKPTGDIQRADASGKLALEAADRLRASALKLQDTGVELIPQVRTYADNRPEVLAELAALKPLLEGPMPSALRTQLENSLAYQPTRSADAWQSAIRKEVDMRYAQANETRDQIAKLNAPLSGEAQQCADFNDVSKAFAGARVAAKGTIDAAMAKVEAAYNARNALIVEEQKKLNEAITKFENVEKAADEKAKIVERQLYSMEPRAPGRKEKEDQFNRLDAQRKQARESIVAIQKQMQTNEQEKQAADQQLPTAKSFFDSTMGFMKGLVGY